MKITPQKQITYQFAGIEGMMTALDDTTLVPKKIPRPVVIGN